MSSLIILGASVFEISWGKQTDRQTDKRQLKTYPATAVGVGNKYVVTVSKPYSLTHLLIAWNSGRTSVLLFGRRTFPVLRSTGSWQVTIYVGKPSAVHYIYRSTNQANPAFHPFGVDR